MNKSEDIIFHRDGRVTSGGELLGQWRGPDRFALSARWVFTSWDGWTKHARHRELLRTAAADAWCRRRTNP